MFKVTKLHLTIVLVTIAGVLLSWSCSKQNPATFTPALRAVSGTFPTAVFLDAQAWVDRDPGNRYFSAIAPTGSMRPYIDENHVVLCVRYRGQALHNGATVIFNRGDTPRVLHVVSTQNDTHVYMSGANNRYSDGWFPRTAIEGVVVGLLALP